MGGGKLNSLSVSWPGKWGFKLCSLWRMTEPASANHRSAAAAGKVEPSKLDSKLVKRVWRQNEMFMVFESMIQAS